ncbi:MAG: acyl-CoA thioesterase II [Pseudomonadales bacterium]
MTDREQTGQLAQLIDFLSLEKIDENLYRGVSPVSRNPRVFGGQVFAQAMRAAQDTVPAERMVHSQHAYFLRAGDPSIPIIFQVDQIRDGGSFTTRRVVALQRGKAIFNTSLSFQLIEEGLSHQDDMPLCPPPEEVEDDEIRWSIDQQKLGEHANRRPSFRPIEMRTVDPVDFNQREKRPAEKMVWMRARGSLPDDHSLHHAVLAYTSDYYLLGTGLLAHAVSFLDPDLQPASLDHAIWFHDDFRVDEWLLYHMVCPRASHARSLNRGSFYTRDGRLVATTMQEGLLRLNRKTI